MIRALAASAAALALAGCGENGTDAVTPAGLEASDPGPVHVHGLGVDPADGSLFIATHTGLWRAAAGVQRAERVGESLQDTMGFTVVGAGHFLGSGHPDLRDARERGLPPLLGLIESRDAGASWEPVSLLGEADFHVLRAAGTTVYGADATSGRLLASADGGKTWARRTMPGPLLDLAVDPADSDHLLASPDSRLVESDDGGRRWRPVAADRVGLLAWARDGAIYLVDAAGRLSVSTDGTGRSWAIKGELGVAPAAFAASAGELVIALHEGPIKVSRDGGATWRVRVAGQS